MTLQERLSALSELGRRLQQPDDYLDAVIHRTAFNNGWLTPDNQRKAIQAIATRMLDADKLHTWAGRYFLPDAPALKNVGLVMAGNIPLVGWHDVQCVFVAGHRAQIKLSDKDQYLLPCLLRMLKQIDARTTDYFEIVSRLRDFDAVIATGSNNTSRYFESYFSHVPNIIRRNRNAVAVLDGSETAEELAALGDDVFRFFGLGCRNVSKIYVPEDYNFMPLLNALHEYREIILHDKYKNNFDYNFALYTLNKTAFYMAGSIMLTENAGFSSRIAALHYERYDKTEALEQQLAAHRDAIQCVIGRSGLLSDTAVIPFGQAQEPELWDYADGVDTMQFLLLLG